MLSHCLSAAKEEALVLLRGGQEIYLLFGLNQKIRCADRLCVRHAVSQADFEKDVRLAALRKRSVMGDQQCAGDREKGYDATSSGHRQHNRIRRRDGSELRPASRRKVRDCLDRDRQRSQSARQCRCIRRLKRVVGFFFRQGCAGRATGGGGTERNIRCPELRRQPIHCRERDGIRRRNLAVEA